MSIRSIFIHDVEGDGNCFYNCLHRLTATSPMLAEVFLKPSVAIEHPAPPHRHVRFSIAELLNQEANTVKENGQMGSCKVFKGTFDMIKTMENNNTGGGGDVTNDFLNDLAEFREFRKKGQKMKMDKKKKRSKTGAYAQEEEDDDNELLAFLSFKRSQIRRDNAYAETDVIVFLHEYLLSNYGTLLLMPTSTSKPVQYASRREVDDNILNYCLRAIVASAGRANNVCVVSRKDQHFNYFRFELDNGTYTHVVPCDSLKEFIEGLKR